MKKKIISFIILVGIVVGVVLVSNNLDFGMAATDMMESDEMSIWGAIFCEAFVSIHMSIFVLFPLAGIINRNNVVKTFIVLFCIRLVILLIGDIINPAAMMIIDFMSVFFGAFILIPVLGFTKGAVYGSNLAFHEYEDLEEHELSNIGFSNKELLKRVLLDQYIDIKYAFSDFDYKKLVELCSKNKYLLYKNELKLLEQVGDKRVFKDLNIIDSKIYDGYKSNDGITVKVVVKLEYYDYTVDNYNKVTNGSDTTKEDVMVELSFFKSLKHKDIEECPNCGSPVTVNSMEFCSYCGTELNFKIGEFVLDTESIVQK